MPLTRTLSFQLALLLFAQLACRASENLGDYRTGLRPRSVAVGDFNGDSYLDAAVANSGDGTVSIFLGIGGGKFQPDSRTIPAGQEPSDVDAIDLDLDGDLDLVIANHETANLTVLLNNGEALFNAAPGSPFATGARPHVHGLAAGDFDHDGWPDVAVDSADTNEVRILRGGPDGLGDLVAVPLGTMPYYRLGVADLNGDGTPEVLAPGHSDNTIRFVHNEGGRLRVAPTIVGLPEKPWMVVGDDVNGDGQPDLIVVHSSRVTVWHAGQSGFGVTASATFSVPGATEVATGDLDGDGLRDIAVGPWEGDEIHAFTGPQRTLTRLRACERPIGLAIADLTNDGRGEIVAACSTENRMVVIGLSRKK